MGNHPSNSHHQQLERGGGVGKFGDVHARRSLRSPRKMDRLRRSFRDSFRRRKERVPESSKPHQWQEDESAVRQGACAFAVKYLGCVEVFESRGMQVCEEALKLLRASRRRTVRAMLHVSGDGLRVVEDDTKGLIVDQTIEKVSFCAPDRNHERAFSYICRDGTTRRWMCHGFLALRDSGERLSHAVGCAFAVCLERKQRRDKECGVTMTFDARHATFTRSGSFRQPSLSERLDLDAPAAPKLTQAPTNTAATNHAVNPFAIERPHATPHMLERQNSFRGFGQLGQNSPFKRQMSLRVQDLPSHAERLGLYRAAAAAAAAAADGPDKMVSVSPIPEVVSGDSVAALCQQLSHGLSQLTHSGSDDFSRFHHTFNNIPSPDISSQPPAMAPTIKPAAGSPNASVASDASLPRPEQWLTHIVGSSSPNASSASTTTTASTTSAAAAPNRRLNFGQHSRAMSLDSSAASSDPFDAEWVPPPVRQNPSTNPFLSGAAQPFQVQL